MASRRTARARPRVLRRRNAARARRRSRRLSGLLGARCPCQISAGCEGNNRPKQKTVAGQLFSSVRNRHHGLPSRNFRFGSQSPHSIRPSRNSSALFFRCLGAVARDRAGTVATRVLKQLTAVLSSSFVRHPSVPWRLWITISAATAAAIPSELAAQGYPLEHAAKQQTHQMTFGREQPTIAAFFTSRQRFPKLWASTLSHSRTSFDQNRWQFSRVISTPCLGCGASRNCTAIFVQARCNRPDCLNSSHCHHSLSGFNVAEPASARWPVWA